MSYIYIGEYYHKHKATTPVPNDKKIGCSVNVPNRETSLNSTNMTIGFRVKSYWQVGKQYKTIETAIHSLLGNARFASTEFFSDDDKTLHRRLTDFMFKMGYKLCDGTEANKPVSPKNVNQLISQKNNKEHIAAELMKKLMEVNTKRIEAGQVPYANVDEFNKAEAVDDEAETEAFLAQIRAKRQAMKAAHDLEHPLQTD